MSSMWQKKRNLVIALTLVGGLIPIFLYWFTTGNHTITPGNAKSILTMSNSNAILVDVRPAEEFEEDHIDGAQNWPLNKIYELSSKDQVPREFSDKMLLLICDAGVSTNYAVKHLAALDIDNVKSVRGGIQEWIADSICSGNCIFERFKSSQNQYNSFPTRESPYYEQVAQVVSGFVIKPVYTILALVIAILLWKRKELDLAALKWSMIFFFVGENFCALNYLLFNDKSYLSEYLHSFGMLLTFSFTTYAIFEGFDSRILHLSEPDKKCAALGLCKKCIKYENVACGLKHSFYMIIPAMAIIALMPLSSDWHTVSYNTTIFGRTYNYSHLLIYQQFERLYCPIIAIILFIVSSLVLLFKKDYPISTAKLFFAAGAGPLGFSLMRTMLAGFYSSNLVWFNVWEEGTELLFIAGVCAVLLIFKQGLFPTELSVH